MSNLVSSGRIIHIFTLGIIVIVGWAVHTKLWHKKTSPPEARPLQPEWDTLVHRNYYGRRQLQRNPNSDRHNMLRDFALISKKDSANYKNRVR